MSCGPCALGTGVGGPNDVGLEGVAGGNVVWRWVLEPVGWRARGGVPVPKRGGIGFTAGDGRSSVGKNCSGAVPVV